MLLVLRAVVLTADTIMHLVVAPQETLTVQVRGEGPPVVFVQGLIGSTWGWRHLTDSLAAEGFRTIAIEPLGTGTSSRPPKADYSITAQAHRIGAVLDVLNQRHAVMVAHSLGGSMVFRLALLRPELISGIVSIEGGPAEEAATSGFRNAMRFAPLIRLFGGKGMVRGKIVKSLRQNSGDPSWVTDEAVGQYTAGPAADFGATLRSYQQLAKATEPELLGPRLHEITVPVTLLLGTFPHSGQPGPEQVELMSHSFARFERLEVKDAGHFLQEERPAAVLDAVRAMTRAPSVVSLQAGRP